MRCALGMKSLTLTLAAWLALALLATPRAGAELPLRDRIPANASVMIGMPDTAEGWSKLEALPLAQAFEQMLQSPAMAGNLDFQEFQLERQKLQAELGFPATLNELLTNVFSSFVFYASPSPDGGRPVSVAALGVKDKAKVQKLLSVMAARYRQEAEAGTTATTQRYALEETRIGDITALHLRDLTGGTGNLSEAWLGIANDMLLFTETQQAFTELSGKAAAAAAPAGNITANPDFARLQKLLPWDKSHLVGWFDGDALLQGGGMSAMLSSMPMMSKSNKAAFAFSAVQGGIEGKVASTADPEQLSPNIKVSELRGPKLVGPMPLVSVTSGMLDAPMMIGQLQAMMNMPGVGGANALSTFETATGISVQNELAPALGNEVTFAINNITPAAPGSGLPIPTVDLIMSAKVKDAAKMKVVMGKLETYLQNSMGGATMNTTDPAAAAPSGFQDVKVGEDTFRTMPIAMAGISPSYLLRNDLLVIGLSQESLGAAMERLRGTQPALTSSPLFQALQKQSGSNQAYGFSLVNVTGIITQVQGIAPMLMGNVPAADREKFAQAMSILGRVGTAAALQTREANTPVAFVKMQMQ